MSRPDSDRRGPRARVGALWRRYRHAAWARALASALQRGYARVRGLRAATRRPAIDGGWPARLVPLPAPRPYGFRERRALRAAVAAQHSSYSDGGSIAAFERELAAAYGVQHAIVVSSGTAALHVALLAAGIGPGDEVLVPALAYASDALVVRHVGATPRFVDVDVRDFGIDAHCARAACTPRSRALLAVHLCGLPCALDELEVLCAERGLVLIEDAAQAHGARHRGRAVGSIGRLGCLSFQSSKALTTGEGGAVFTRDATLARRARLFANIGETVGGIPTGVDGAWRGGGTLDYECAGFNYRISALQASLGRAQLACFDARAARRQRAAERMFDVLRGLPGVVVPRPSPGAEPRWSSVFFLLDPSARRGRDELARALARERIDYRMPYARPLPAHALFAAALDADEAARHFAQAERICAHGLGLRLDAEFSDGDVEDVAGALRSLLG